ncbi:MAG: hypothetical protein PVH29_11810 [Candidatus Zixiibacteriota bacterium]|jgi:hypothetical protein
MADEPEQIVYEVSVEGAEEAIRALKEGEAEDVKFIIVMIREVRPWHGLLQ